MITFPKSLIPAYRTAPGYFWCREKHILYSIKSGELRPIAKRRANRWFPYGDYYTISNKGHKRCWIHKNLVAFGEKYQDRDIELQIKSTLL